MNNYATISKLVLHFSQYYLNSIYKIKIWRQVKLFTVKLLTRFTCTIAMFTQEPETGIQCHPTEQTKLERLGTTRRRLSCRSSWWMGFQVQQVFNKRRWDFVDLWTFMWRLHIIVQSLTFVTVRAWKQAVGTFWSTGQQVGQRQLRPTHNAALCLVCCKTNKIKVFLKIKMVN